MKQLFYANPLSILSLPTHIQYHMQSFFLLRRLLQSPKNALNTIFISMALIIKLQHPAIISHYSLIPEILVVCLYYLYILVKLFTLLITDRTKVCREKNLDVSVKMHFRDVQQLIFYNENNVSPAQLQKTLLNRKGILAAVPIC